MEGNACGEALYSGHGEREIGGHKQAVPVFEKTGVPAEIFEAAAQAVPERGAGAEKGRIPQAAGGGAAPRAGEDSPLDGKHLRYRDPRVGGEIFDGGSSAGRLRGDCPEGKDPHHPDSWQAVPEAAEIRQKTKNRLR